MPGTMNEADLVADLKASLNDARSVFTVAADGDFKRHLAVAALDFARKRARTLVGAIVLIADQASYAAPADLLRFKSSLWGIVPTARPQPWEKNWPGRLPDVRVVEEAAARKLYLEPAPTAAQIAVLGADFRYYYFAGHAVGADAAQTTIFAGERGLFLLRAQAEAMRELAFRNVVKPVTVRDGLSSQPRNGTPSFLHGALMTEFEAATL